MAASSTEQSPSPEPRDGFVAAERARRLARLDALRERGIEPYPVTFPRDHSVAEVLEAHAGLAPDTQTGERVGIAGRLTARRIHGGLLFLDLHDQTGDVQVLVRRDAVGPEAFADARALDRGDWIGVTGTVMTTRTGELSVDAEACVLLSKALRALPPARAGLTDVDTRFRQRYLDLIANPSVRRTFDIRSKIISSVRRTLTDRGFTEVETPVLDTAAGGAAARPFITHHNALDIDMYLRIALELPLKRLVVGGFERVFEIGRVFRNEGLDTRHNPEFTLLEAYQALGDYHDMMDLVEAICSEAAIAATGTTKITVEGKELDLAPPWRRVTMADLIEENNPGVRMHPSMPLEEARAICDRLGVPYEAGWSAGRLMSEVYDETCEHTLDAPTFVYDYPREVSPLARTHRDDPTLVERFEAVVAGRELANAYSELNDPVDQRGRFEAEAAAKAAGDEEAQDIDEDYIRALEYALPPTGGLGIGLDRLVMLVAGAATIREVILFPTMRPEGGRGRRGLSSEAVPTAEELAEASRAAAPESDAVAMVAAEPPQPRAALQPAHRRAPRVLAWLTALTGLMYLLPSIPVLHERLGVIEGYVLPLSGRVAIQVTSVLAGLLLVLVAPQLARRKRRAWIVALALFAVAGVAGVLSGPHPLATGLAVAMVIALVWFRGTFSAQPDPGSLLAVARFVPVYLAGVLVFGVASLALESDRLDPGLTAGGVLETIFGGLVGLAGPYEARGRYLNDFFPAALLALGIAGLVIASLLAYRALAQRGAPTEDDRRRARVLARRWGSDTLAPFALRPDKSYFFTAAGDAVIAYTVVSGYALVAADPIGPPGSVGRALDEFTAFCRDRAWRIAFLAVREADLPEYRRLGFHGVYMGDEAIIRCDTFRLDAPGMKAVRSAVNRVSKRHSFRLLRETDAPPSLVEELNRIRERWRGKNPERGFTMELGSEVGAGGGHPDFLLAIAFDDNQKPVGFLRIVPCYGDDPGYSLDLMQRNPDAANGLTEFLIASAALALGERGFRRLSMNFAAWGRLFDPQLKLSPAQRVARRVVNVLNPFFQVRSLRDFNEKFQPEWLPRSIVVEDASAIPTVALLYASVEGFVRLPVVGRYLVPPVRAERPQRSGAGMAAAPGAVALKH